MTFSTPSETVTRTYSINGGTESDTYTAPTTDGAYTVVVTDTDVAGNIKTGSLTFTLDTTLTAPTVALTADSGSSNTDLITKDGSLTFSTPSETVTRTYSINGGTASDTYTAPTTDGAYTVVVTDTDVAGNIKTGSLTFTLDTTLTAPTVALTADSGSSNTDLITKDGSLTFSTPSETVTRTYSINGGTASDTYTAPTTDGAYTVVVTDTDVAGNIKTGSLTFTLDTTAPSIISIIAANSNLSSGEATMLTFSFSETPVGFTSADITCVGGVVTNLVQSLTDPKVFTATFTQTGTDTPSVSVANATYTDTAGNNGTGNSLTMNLEPATNDVQDIGNEDTTITVTLSGSDDGSVAGYQITTLPNNGILYKDAGMTQTVLSGETVVGTTLYFKPTSNWSGNTNFTYSAVDNMGVIDSTPATATVNVVAVADTPSINFIWQYKRC